MLTVQVHRWSQAVTSLLLPQQEMIGRVHSCYARIINVYTPSGRLLTLQGEGLLQAPLGLALATDVAALETRLPVGVLVVQDIPTTRGPQQRSVCVVQTPSSGMARCGRSP